MNNSSMRSADRATHFKVVVVSLIASIVVIIIGISTMRSDLPVAQIEASAPVIKAGSPSS
ncbi:MAG TPA: hypothetical protein VIH40_06460 [Xanthobacteraceae bacterium]